MWTPSILLACSLGGTLWCLRLWLVQSVREVDTPGSLMCPLCGGWLRYLDGIGWWECMGCDEWWGLAELREAAERRSPEGKSTGGRAHPRVVSSGRYPVA